MPSIQPKRDLHNRFIQLLPYQKQRFTQDKKTAFTSGKSSFSEKKRGSTEHVQIRFRHKKGVEQTGRL